MRILIASDGINAHYPQRLSWLNAFSACGHTAALWDIKAVSAFDAFDQLQPDLFMGQSYNLDQSTIKCIHERPHMKVALRAGDWGEQESEVDKTKYNILFCSQKEKDVLKKLKDETGKPDFVHIHYSDDSVKKTHNHFETIGIKSVSLMMCADPTVYANAKFDNNLECDIGFVGGYWPYKAQVMDKYLTPLLYPINRYKTKIFGNQPWGVPQYCGVIDDNDIKNLFVSAKICPNLSEPHAQKFGIDVNERIFKILYAGGFCISDNVESYKMFGDGLVIAGCHNDFKEKIDHYLKNPEQRVDVIKRGHQYVKENHTGLHRVATIFNQIGNNNEASRILTIYRDTINV